MQIYVPAPGLSAEKRNLRKLVPGNRPDKQCWRDHWNGPVCMRVSAHDNHRTCQTCRMAIGPNVWWEISQIWSVYSSGHSNCCVSHLSISTVLTNKGTFHHICVRTNSNILEYMKLIGKMSDADIGKTFGPLTDRRTGYPIENSKFYWSSKTFTRPDIIQHESPHTGAPYRNFFTGQEDWHNKGFHGSSTVFTGRGPRTGGFPDVCCWTMKVFRLHWCVHPSITLLRFPRFQTVYHIGLNLIAEFYGILQA